MCNERNRIPIPKYLAEPICRVLCVSVPQNFLAALTVSSLVVYSVPILAAAVKTCD